MNKIIFFSLFLCSFFLRLNAQTTPIEHKSHSGSSENMPILREGGFGEPGTVLLKVIKLDENTVILITREWQGEELYSDTIKKHPFFSNPKMTLEDFRLGYPNVTFKGFETKEKVEQPKMETAPKQKGKTKKKKRKFSSFIEMPFDAESRLLWGAMGILGLCSLAAVAHYRQLKNQNNA